MRFLIPLALSANTALACTDSVYIAQSHLADAIDAKCNCTAGSTALGYTVHRSAFLRGLSTHYLDDWYIQSSLHIMNEVERYTCRNQSPQHAASVR